MLSWTLSGERSDLHLESGFGIPTSVDHCFFKMCNLRADQTTLILLQVAEQRPFLAFGWFHAPHLPVVSAPPWTDM